MTMHSRQPFLAALHQPRFPRDAALAYANVVVIVILVVVVVFRRPPSRIELIKPCPMLLQSPETLFPSPRATSPFAQFRNYKSPWAETIALLLVCLQLAVD